MKTKVYDLLDPRTEQIRYVGITTDTLVSRLYQHIWDAKQGTTFHVSNWIRQLLVGGLKPTIRLRQECETWESACACERELIATLPNLTNLTAGGEGTLGYHHTEDSRRKMSEAQVRPGVKEKIAAATSGPKSAAHRQKIGEQLRRTIVVCTCGRELSRMTLSHWKHRGHCPDCGKDHTTRTG